MSSDTVFHVTPANVHPTATLTLWRCPWCAVEQAAAWAGTMLYPAVHNSCQLAEGQTDKLYIDLSVRISAELTEGVVQLLNVCCAGWESDNGNPVTAAHKKTTSILCTLIYNADNTRDRVAT